MVSVLRRPGGAGGQEAAYTCDTLLACDPISLATGVYKPAAIAKGGS